MAGVASKYSHCYRKAIIVILFCIILHYEAGSRHAGDMAHFITPDQTFLTLKD